MSIQPHQPVETAAQLMAKHGVHALAVVGPNDDLLGIITTTDITHAALGGHETGPTMGVSAAPDAEPPRIRLSAEQLDQALAAATMQADTDRDLHFVHRALAHMHARVALLE